MWTRSTACRCTAATSLPTKAWGWSFREFHLRPRPDACDCVYQGRAAAYIREQIWPNRTDNVGIKYVHTRGGSASYTLSFLNSVITVNPSDANQWSDTAFATFSH